MEWKEAKRVKRRIHMDAPSLRVDLRQIGNGEWVCVLNAGAMWIWDEQDWEDNKNSAAVIAMRMIA